MYGFMESVRKQWWKLTWRISLVEWFLLCAILTGLCSLGYSAYHWRQIVAELKTISDHDLLRIDTIMLFLIVWTKK